MSNTTKILLGVGAGVLILAIVILVKKNSNQQK
jgi:hypothetical protein